MDKCKSCGAEMVEGAKFCIICGTTAQIESQETIEEEGLKAEAAIIEEQEVCPSCKASLRKGASFCVSCGTSVKDTAIAPLEPEPDKKKQPEAETSKKKNKIASAEPEKKTAKRAEETQETPVDDTNIQKEVAQPTSKKGGQDKLNKIEDWVVTTGEEPARQIDELDILSYGQGTVSKITFNKSLASSNLIVHGKVKCHGCNKLSIFSLPSNRGWGGSNDPSTCPCGRKVEIGEYWSNADDAIFVWASTETEDIDIKDYPLSINISRVTEA